MVSPGSFSLNLLPEPAKRKFSPAGIYIFSVAVALALTFLLTNETF
jgi:hypothetical protein